MRVKTIPSTWIDKNGYRFDCNPYMGGAVEVKIALESMKSKSDVLKNVVSSRFGGIYHAGRYRRVWVANKDYGLPFLSTRDVMQSDLSKLSYISNKSIEDNPKLLVHQDQILITRSGSVGRMSYVNSHMDGMSCTEDVLRVEVDKAKICAGYLYAFLKSSYGIPLVLVGTYGAMIRHIEAEHIENMPVPRLGFDIETKIDEFIKSSYELRATFQHKVNEATKLLFDAAELRDITSSQWHEQGADLGFSINLKSSHSLRALNYGSRFLNLLAELRKVKHKTVGEICLRGQLKTGPRFKRIDAAPDFGMRLLGQKQGFWSLPEGRWISIKHSPDGLKMKDETVLIAEHGTLGEREVFCRSILVTGSWLNYAYSQDFLRVESGDAEVSGAYLFAFLRSETVFRCLRSMSMGSKQQEIKVSMVADLPVPIISNKDRAGVEKLVREAFEAKERADELESSAVSMIEDEIRRGAKAR